MSKLLSNLETGVKQAYQSYTIEHGIERIAVLVPLKQVPLFEGEFSRMDNKTKQAIIHLVDRVGGKVRG